MHSSRQDREIYKMYLQFIQFNCPHFYSMNYGNLTITAEYTQNFL